VKFVGSAARGWAGLVVRLALAAVWAWAAWSKLGNPRQFVQAVRAYDATPEWLSQGIGYGLPVLELSISILLVLGLIVRYAALASVFLLVVFTIGIAQASIRGIKLECGCFGGGGQSNTTTYTLDILRDIGLLVLAVFLIIWPMTKLSIDEWLIKSEMIPGLTPRQAKSEKSVRRYKAAVAAAEVELKHKQRYLGAGTAAAVVLVSLIAIGVQGGRAKITGTVDATNASASSGVRVGNQQAPVTVDIYEDFQCPFCNQLEQSGLTKDFDAKIKATTIKVNYHVESFLDSSSNGNKYSSRAANAGYCASDVSADAFLKFHDIAYGKDSTGKDNQPAENTNGRPDSSFIAWGKQAGITSADFSTCVSSNQYANLVVAVTEAASKAGVTGTPTVFVAGKRVGSASSVPTVAQIDAAIQTALSKAKSTAAPSATPSATKSGSAGASASASASASGSQ
jgi:protein-disulfide isomerase/uncharacterized membrane protein YphA (DoxX/SURF4 family)